jgi:hypothetical protein
VPGCNTVSWCWRFVLVILTDLKLELLRGPCLCVPK